MRVVAVVSMKGGVGKTTLTANLACALARVLGPMRAWTVDLDPQNAMHWHLGLNAAAAPGICTNDPSEMAWPSRLLRSETGVGCLPYGAHKESTRVAFENKLAQDPLWLKRHVQATGFPAGSFVLIDTPPGPTVYLQQACRAADAVLAVVLADAASYATMPALLAWTSEAQSGVGAPSRLWCVLNQVDLSDPLNRDVGELLKSQLGASLLPVCIHRDEAVGEALAFQKSVLEYAPQSQASLEFAQLAQWLAAATDR